MPDSTSNTHSARASGLRGLFPAFPGTKDIELHPVFKGRLSKWAWRFYTHRLTRSGRWLLVLTFILSFGLVPSLDIQAFIPLIYVSALWLVALVVLLLNGPSVEVKVHHASRMRAGETLPVEISITQRRRQMPGLELNVLPERLPLEIDAEPPAGVPIATVASGETRRLRFGLKCARRGSYRLWGYRVESDFPFGLLNAYRCYHQPTSLIVHPAFEPITRMSVPIGRRYQPGGVLFASKSGDSFEYIGNREYREGDNVRDIDWRATARHGGTPVALREYREEYFVRVGLVLDTYLPRSRRAPEREARAQALENAISLCAAAAEYFTRQEYLVDLFAAGPNLYHLTAGRSLAYPDEILDILSCVEGSVAEPLNAVAPQIQDYVSRLTTVVCILLDWDARRRTFVEKLREGGVGVKVIVIPSNPHFNTESGTPIAEHLGDATVIRQEEFRSGVQAL